MKQLFGMLAVALTVALVGCTGTAPSHSGSGAGAKKVAVNPTGNPLHDAATIFKSLDAKNTGTISLTEFQAIPTDGITKTEKVKDAAAREKTFNEYAKDGTMNEQQFIKCYTDLTAQK
jgi:hypothetical protein